MDCGVLSFAERIYCVRCGVEREGGPDVQQEAVVKLVRFGDMKEAWRLHRRGDFAVMMITFLLTFAMGIQIGIGVGIMVSIILTLKRSAFPRFHTLGQVPGTVVFRSVDNDRSVTQFPGVAVTRMDAELYFANSAVHSLRQLGHLQLG